MNKTNEIKPVQDYWKFTRELSAQLNAVKALERSFFGLDDLCEWSIKNGAAVLNDEGERVSIINDCLGKHQCEVYMKLRKAVRDLDVLLASGEYCFTNQIKSDGKSE